MSQPEKQSRHAGLARRLADTRAFSEALCEPLTAEDMGLQACPEVSPPRWHLAHTTWFFETFILKPFAPGYKPSDDRFEYLFNSYYNGVGEQYPRPQRHLLSRPGNEAVRAWRASVDEAMQALLTGPDVAGEVADLVALGIEHEQQHQELLVTDLKFSFSHNPLAPVYRPRQDSDAQAPPLRWHEYPGGLTELGADPAEGFCFDNETPRHRQWLEPFALASRPATCGEYLAFIEDGGYQRPELWLSDGWAWLKEQGAQAPLYWDLDGDTPAHYTLAGRRPINPQEPVAHLNYYEADAFARWSGKRLPTEAEWEHAAARLSAATATHAGFVDSRRFHPGVAGADSQGPAQMFGDVWEWTASAYLPYPGFTAAAGAVGEYNGKFMCNQMVLRGGSCASAPGHLRATYRNFFYPHLRWQFSGVRLAHSMEASRAPSPTVIA